MRPDALELVLRATASLKDGERLPEEVRHWLAEGFDALLGGDDMAEALGLKPDAGQSSIATQYRMVIRDAHLRAAWELLPGTPWARSVALAEEVKRFATRVWRGDATREARTPIERELLAAFRISGGEVPRSTRGLDRVVTTAAKPPVFISQKHAA